MKVKITEKKIEPKPKQTMPTAKKENIQKQKPFVKPAAKTASTPKVQFFPKPMPAALPKPEAKKHSSLVLIIVVVVLISALLIFLGFDKNGVLDKGSDGDEKSKTNGTINGENGNGEEEPKTFDERYDLCLNISSVQAKDECLQAVAIEFNQDFLCDELTNLDPEKCKREVWKAYAVLSQEVEKCNELFAELDSFTEFDRINCIKQIALNSSDKSVCFEIDDLAKKNGCLIELAVQEKDLIVCDSIEGSAKETCKFNAIIAISDVSLCDSLSLPSTKFDCISRIAKQENDVSLCEKISNATMKNKCIRDLS